MKQYNLEYRRKFPEKEREKHRNWRKNNPDKVRAKSARERAVRLQAMPKHANEYIINIFYKVAQTLTKISGIQHHVDHKIPLQHDQICGLHHELNLQILTAKQNLRKNNRFNGRTSRRP